MKIKSAIFKTSVANEKSLPNNLVEFVFAGKSNVGKSSLINLLVDQKKLAISSNTPGRTRLINFFEINQCFYFVDLPGYGYSKSGKLAEITYSKLIDAYLNNSKRIKQVFILIDIRNGIGANDKILIDFCYGKLPFTIICTKADKLSKAIANQKRIKIAQELGLPKESVIMVSTTTKIGKDDILQKIEDCLKDEGIC